MAVTSIEPSPDQTVPRGTRTPVPCSGRVISLRATLKVTIAAPALFTLSSAASAGSRCPRR